MRRVLKCHGLMLAAVGFLAVGSVAVMAQSGSRNDSTSGSGSGQRVQQAPLALEGYCPVSVLEMRKWVKGVPAYEAVYDGRAYRFANEKGEQMFKANPAKYVPALGGDCVVAMVQMGRRIPGNIRHASTHQGRLYLLSNADGQKMFLAEPAAYANVDLALEGHCPVCLVSMGKSVRGSPEIAAIHGGKRYLFPKAEYRNVFLANPAKFVRNGGGATQPGGGSTTKGPAGSGSGSR